ncbi:MAG: tetratricopeptide repeat protein [Candidatus Marinimicrobia bacterium]|nr:tetratricopeptide repeat protein [Candidatus Neomarinimicrobiota bacterium]
MSQQKDQEYFCDGMAEELIDGLAKIEGLHVVSRTSAFQYKGTAHDIRKIGEQLNVGSVLEGSVRKAGKRLRITTQLVNVADGYHLWSEKYDRDLEDVFAIQDDIAQTIVNILKIKLVGEQAGVLVKRPTKNLDAYDYYLRGNHYLYRTGARKDLRLAVQMFEKATNLEPGFALAYARLGAAHNDFYWLHFDRSKERLALAKQAIVKALELEPDLPEAHGALGAYYYEGELDYDRALKELAIAQESQPNNSELVATRGFIQRRRGEWEQALSNLQKASELDPRVSLFAQEVGDTYGYMRNYQEAERYLDRAISLTPDWLSPYHSKAWLYLRWEGSPDKARTVLEQASEAMDSADPVIFYLRVLLDLFDGIYQAALERLASASSEAFDSQFYFIPRDQLYAQIYGLSNQPREEQASYESAQSLLEIKVQDQPDDARFHSALGIAFAGLGRKKEAIREGKRSVDLMPISKDALRGLFRVANLAQIYVMVGEHDAALDQIESLLSIPGELSVPLLRLDPTWAPLRDHPRFTDLLDKYGGAR